MRSEREDPFDRHARGYDATWGADPVASRHRRRVLAALTRRVRPGALILDLGCGTGTDAAELARRGLRVVAVDRSEGMVERARVACAGLAVDVHRVDLGAPGGLPPGPFDAVLANFGVLNCVAVAPLARAVAARTGPGAPWVAVVMPRWSPMEIAAFALAGHPREALLRRTRPWASVGDGRVDVQWLAADDVRRRAEPWFDLVDHRALGLVTPPPRGRDVGVGRRVLSALDWADRRLGALPGLRRLGDHLQVTLIRTVTPASVEP